ncbi:MAG: preprotein translocase subunit SecY [Clostridiales bacterium]|jgi:preprotein translocase subunit SecY|nr:preprotein translocase subunit SecY [Clostridiales bacterium]
MFETIKEAWALPDLRRKIFYTIMLIIIFRIGSFIPVPFMDAAAMQQLINSAGDASIIGLLNMFSGGAFANATIFAMSITPYINSSIIMQLLTIAIPALERMQREGEDGRKKINQWTRYLTIVLAFIQAAGLYVALQEVTERGLIPFLVMTITFTTGTAFLMWLGEQINEKGIGNGISLIIFAGIVSRAPTVITTLQQSYVNGSINVLGLLGIVLLALITVVAVVIMNDSERRLQVQYAKRIVGRKMYGGQSTHIPIKLLAAGVIPIIFALSIMAFPSTIAAFFGVTSTSGGVMGTILSWISPDSWIYAIVTFLLIIFFTYFYTFIQFNPVEVANNMKRSGGFLPGLRPGKPTAEYIAKVVSRVTFAGAVFLGILAIMPNMLNIFTSVNVGIGGASVLIVVGVALETTKQLESNMVVRNYKGFLE